MVGKKESQVMNLFMVEELERMSELERYDKSTKQARVNSPLVERCGHCKKEGHTTRYCRTRRNEDRPKTVVNAVNASKDCPNCGQAHTYTNREDKEMASSRFSDCSIFYSLTTSEKAQRVESVGGCAWCLDWSGGHKAQNCTWKGM